MLYLSDVEDGGETFFPHAREWFDRDHDEYLQRNTCPNGDRSTCLYPSLTPTRGKIAYPKNFTTAEVLVRSVPLADFLRSNKTPRIIWNLTISVIFSLLIVGREEWLGTAGELPCTFCRLSRSVAPRCQSNLSKPRQFCSILSIQTED